MCQLYSYCILFWFSLGKWKFKSRFSKIPSILDNFLNGKSLIKIGFFSGNCNGMFSFEILSRGIYIWVLREIIIQMALLVFRVPNVFAYLENEIVPYLYYCKITIFAHFETQNFHLFHAQRNLRWSQCLKINQKRIILLHCERSELRFLCATSEARRLSLHRSSTTAYGPFSDSRGGHPCLDFEL